MSIKIPNRLLILKSEEGDIVNVDASIIGGKSVTFSFPIFRHSLIMSFTKESVRSAAQKILDMCQERET